MMTMMMMMMMMIRLQVEAALLRGVVSGSLSTKIIVLGIGGFLDETELHGMASPPTDSTVILVPGFSSLSTVEVQLRDTTCDRTCHSLSCYISACMSIRTFQQTSQNLLFTIKIVAILTVHITTDLNCEVKLKASFQTFCLKILSNGRCCNF